MASLNLSNKTLKICYKKDISEEILTLLKNQFKHYNVLIVVS